MNRLLPIPDPAALDSRAVLASRMALTAGVLAMAGFAGQGSGTVGRKGPQDFLTETDGAVEAHLRACIAEAFPGDRFLGEETGADAGITLDGPVWVVDPIDGTANFARGIGHFCISIACVIGGQTQISVIHAPAVGELYQARRGQGATRNDVPIRVAGTDHFDAACVELGWSLRVPRARYVDTLTGMLDHGANVRRAASGALGLAYVADGRSDGYVELHMNAWDCLAGLLLVQEAGGRVCDFLTAGALMGGGPVLAAAPRLAERLSAIAQIPLLPREQGDE